MPLTHSFLKPGKELANIYKEKSLKKEGINLAGQKFFLLFEKQKPHLTPLDSLSPNQLSSLRHLALTKEENLLYLKFICCPKKDKEIVKTIRHLTASFSKQS